MELGNRLTVRAAHLDPDAFGGRKVEVDLVVPVDPRSFEGRKVALKAEDVGDIVLADLGRGGAFDRTPGLGGGRIVGVVAADDGGGGVQAARREQSEEQASHQRAWISASNFSRPWP